MCAVQGYLMYAIHMFHCKFMQNVRLKMFSIVFLVNFADLTSFTGYSIFTSIDIEE